MRRRTWKEKKGTELNVESSYRKEIKRKPVGEYMSRGDIELGVETEEWV